MLLEFIAEPVVGPKDRRLIRSHVMKGKNAGKPRPPRKALARRYIQSTTATLSEVNCLQTDNQLMLSCENPLLLDRLLWNDLMLASFPECVSPETTKFVYHRLQIVARVCYPLEFCLELNLSKYAWFTYVLEDKAYFHCLLAISSSFPADAPFGCGPRHISPAALKHMTTAYRLVNQRLGSAEACSDKAIAVVTILCIFQRMHHQHEIGLVHFEGLKRMIELRGGLRKLSAENRSVAQKPWRLALEFALQDGSPVAFGLDDVPLNILHISPPKEIPPVSSLCADLHPHLAIISSFTSRLHNLNTNPSTKLDAYDYSDATCIRLHRLLDYAPLAPSRQQRLSSPENVVHLTLIAVLTTLLPEYGLNQARYDLLACQMGNALRIYASMSDRKLKIILWSLFVGYVTVLPASDHIWLMPLASEVCGRLGTVTWAAVHEILCQYAWIGVFYDKAGVKLWSTIS